jgi:pyruvate kinase
MVARGDLGVEIPPENVPAAQKKIVRACRALGKPVIVATQMLESMIESPQPTRAEASDVAIAIYDGADCVMLSAETAAGAYPVEAVSMMDRIATSVEKDELYRKIMDADHPHTETMNVGDSITAAAYHVATDVNAAAIVNYTTSGSTALRTARHRPTVPVLCLTENEVTARRMALSYGVRPVLTIDVDNFDDMVTRASRIARTKKFAEKGDRLVITAGVPFGTIGSTNILRIAKVE